ncbi:MAG: hypothetical protein M3N95_05780 [Actinomycetota bacterium]|nr:hypothetical protein [Actinomycetota bacterium]
MTDLADAVLPLIRTRADLWRWGAANEHGRQMHEAVAMLEKAAETADPVVVFAVTQKAIASALKVIMRAERYWTCIPNSRRGRSRRSRSWPTG